MGEDDTEDDGDVEVTRIGLRDGGWIGFNDEALFIDDGGDEKLKVRHTHVKQLELQTIEWDLAVMSIVLIGLGLFVGVTRNIYVGIGFGAVGAWSLYRTYSNRYELLIRVEERPKPLKVHPVNPKECHDMLATATDLETWGHAGE